MSKTMSEALKIPHFGYDDEIDMTNIVRARKVSRNTTSRIPVLRIRDPLLLCSVADPGCLSRIPDPNLFHPGSQIRIFPSRIHTKKSLNILTQKIGFKLSFGNMIRVVHPGSRIQGSKRHRIPDPNPQHCFYDPWTQYRFFRDLGSGILKPYSFLGN